ncbi:MAG: hypothetical protein M1839_008420 [Geoglossum umbratile]|nr:MAG: hypothetical protein M1839_008420 [Geoglossum umbratile]
MDFRKQKCAATKTASMDAGLAATPPDLAQRSGISGIRIPRPKLTGRARRGGSNVEASAVRRALPSLEIGSPGRASKGFAFLRHRRSVRELKTEDNHLQRPLPGRPTSPGPDNDELEEHGTERKSTEGEAQVDELPQSTGGYLGVLKDGSIHWVEEAIAAVEAIGTESTIQQPKEHEPQQTELSPLTPTKPQRPKIQLRIPHTNYTVFPAPTTLSARALRMSRSRSKSAPHVQTPGKTSPSAMDSVVSPLSPVGDRERLFAPLRSANLSTGAIDTRSPSPNTPSPSPPAPASASDSSCKTNDRGDAGSCFSARSSMSSVVEDTKESKPSERIRESWRSSGVFPNGAFPIIKAPDISPVLDDVPPQPSGPPPKIPPKNANVSIPSPDLCKPLPPDPAINLKPAPLRIVSQSRTPYAGPLLKPPRAVSPSSWMITKQKLPPPLKNKFSSSELDRIDYAFLQSSPKRIDDMEAFVAATEALESSIKKELHAISEDMGFESSEPAEPVEPVKPIEPVEPIESAEPTEPEVLTLDSPLQISRGPLAMVPSRPAPQPPTKSRSRKIRRLYHSMSNITPNLKPPVLSIRHAVSAEWERAELSSPEVPDRDQEEKNDLPGTTGVDNAADSPLDVRAAVMKRAKLPRDDQIAYGRPRPRANPRAQKSSPMVSRVPRRAPSVSRALSITSLAISDITQWYLETPPTPVDDTEVDEVLAIERRDEVVQTNAARTVVLNILLNVDNLQDLFALAQTSKGFYVTFKRNELRLIKNALWAMSPAAWELREVSPPYGKDEELNMDRPVPEYTPTSYLRHHSRDLYTMVALKSIILVRCETFLRPETKAALAGEDDERSRKLDDAFWRVWTFCKLFGCNKRREDDIVGQVDWLKGGALANQEEKCSASVSFVQGTADACVSPTSCLLNPPEAFGKGNGDGLTRGQLSDMMEIWTCLGILLTGFHGQCRTANEFGIFGSLRADASNVDSKEWLLDEWICYLLTLGPSVILDLASPSEQQGPVGFGVAAENGWTKWEAPLSGKSRSTFMKEAIKKVYDERTLAATRRKATERAFSQELERRKRAKQVAEMRAKRNNVTPPPAAIELPGDSPTSYAPVPFSSSAFSPASTTPSQPLPGVAPSPPQYFTAATLTSPKQAKYPLEKAVFQIVGMGFTAAEAKRALAETDTHDRLDVHAAVEVLLRRRKASAGIGGIMGRVELR